MSACTLVAQSLMLNIVLRKGEVIKVTVTVILLK